MGRQVLLLLLDAALHVNTVFILLWTGYFVLAFLLAMVVARSIALHFLLGRLQKLPEEPLGNLGRCGHHTLWEAFLTLSISHVLVLNGSKHVWNIQISFWVLTINPIILQHSVFGCTAVGRTKLQRNRAPVMFESGPPRKRALRHGAEGFAGSHGRTPGLRSLLGVMSHVLFLLVLR